MPMEIGNAMASPTISMPRDQQHVCDVEDEAAQRCVEKVDVVGCMEVCQEGVRIAGAAAHRKSEHKGYEEDAQTVVPIIEFEAIVLCPFEGICEGAPADGAEDSHQKCNLKGGWNKHAAKLRLAIALDGLSFVREAAIMPCETEIWKSQVITPVIGPAAN